MNRIDQTFREMTRDQFEQIEQETKQDEQVKMRLMVMTLLSLLVLSVTASILARRHANQMTRPIKALAQAAEYLSRVGLSEESERNLIPPGDDEEIGDLIVSFNRMQRNLKGKPREARNRLQEVEQKNQLLGRTKRAMTGIMTELKEERQKLDKQKHFFESVVESSPNGMIITNEKGRIILINRMIEVLFGYTRSELLNNRVDVLIPSRFQKNYSGYIKGFHANPSTRKMGGDSSDKTLFGRKKDGSEFPLEIGLSPIHQDSEEIFVLATIVDISDRKEADEKLLAERTALKKSNLELDTFVYTASHDLRAPLRGISSFSKFLEEDYADRLDDEGRDHLKRIRKGVSRMVNLIDDLLSLSKTSRQDNPYEEVKVDQMIRSVMERLEFDLEPSRVNLVIPAHLPVISCDRIKVSEVFLNLINNAIKFSEKNNSGGPGQAEGPKVEVGFQEEDEDYRFSVKDNGIGIDPKYHEKIFGIFQRLHGRGEYEGTGAGLSIVKRVIDDHNGRVWIDSELGAGATFHFTIPKNIAEG